MPVILGWSKLHELMLQQCSQGSNQPYCQPTVSLGQPARTLQPDSGKLSFNNECSPAPLVNAIRGKRQQSPWVPGTNNHHRLERGFIAPTVNTSQHTVHVPSRLSQAGGAREELVAKLAVSQAGCTQAWIHSVAVTARQQMRLLVWLLHTVGAE